MIRTATPQAILRRWAMDPRTRPAPGQPGTLYQQLVRAAGGRSGPAPRPRSAAWAAGLLRVAARILGPAGGIR